MLNNFVLSATHEHQSTQQQHTKHNILKHTRLNTKYENQNTNITTRNNILNTKYKTKQQQTKNQILKQKPKYQNKTTKHTLLNTKC